MIYRTQEVKTLSNLVNEKRFGRLMSNEQRINKGSG